MSSVYGKYGLNLQWKELCDYYWPNFSEFGSGSIGFKLIKMHAQVAKNFQVEQQRKTEFKQTEAFS